MKHVVFVPEPIAASGMDLLRSECDLIAPWADQQVPSPMALQELFTSVDGALVRLFAIRAGDMASAPRLKVIAKHGVGVDNIDVAAATALKIPVLFTPLANANAVAEHALALMLALARQIVPASEALRNADLSDALRFLFASKLLQGSFQNRLKMFATTKARVLFK